MLVRLCKTGSVIPKVYRYPPIVLDKQFGMSVIDPFGAGDKLRKLREYEDWTQEYVAAQMGIAKNTLSDYELSKVRISREKLELAAALFEVDVNLFFSPDPLTFNLHGNHGTQVARVGNDLVQHKRTDGAFREVDQRGSRGTEDHVGFHAAASRCDQNHVGEAEVA